MELDALHLRMLTLLRSNARITMSALADELGISRPNAYARLDALVSNGVITSFTTRVDPDLVGKPIAALVFVTLDQRLWAEFRDQLDTLPQLEYFAVTTGQHDGMLLMRAASVPEMHHSVVNNIARWPSVRSTETVFLMDEQRFDYSIEPSAPEPVAEAALGKTRFISTPAPPMDGGA